MLNRQIKKKKINKKANKKKTKDYFPKKRCEVIKKQASVKANDSSRMKY